MFHVFITILLIATIGPLVFPFFRKNTLTLIDDQAAVLDEEEVNLTIERRTIASSISELDVDFEQGKLPTNDYKQQKLKLEHRLLEVLDQLDQLLKVKQKKRKQEQEPVQQGKSWFSIAMLILIMAGGSTGTYQLIQWKFEEKSFAADTNPNAGIAASAPIDPAKMVARLEKKLAEDPDNLQGQMMIGRSYMTMGRWDDAEKAWTKVLELDPRNYTAHYRLGEILLSNPKTGTREEAEVALAHFDKALMSVPQDASILWAKGIVLLQLGRIQETDEVWAEAFGYIPPGTESSEMVKKALQDLRSGKMPTSQ